MSRLSTLPKLSAVLARESALVGLLFASFSGSISAAEDSEVQLAATFSETVQPFLETYCISCHGDEKMEEDLNFSYDSMAESLEDSARFDDVIHALESEDMPPQKAKKHPSAEARQVVIDWFQAVHDDEIQRNAGDPGIVLARRLSNSEYDYTIRDLTGVDLKPTREFPAYPSNMEGFDNSGESLVMSPGLLNKYLKAARETASHLYLTRKGFGFAPHPMLVDTDRDKFCVQQIIDFYHTQNTNYADYFQAAWRFKNRAALGMPDATITTIAVEENVSAKYLATLLEALDGAREEVGPLAKLQAMWSALPGHGEDQATAVRRGCEEMQRYVTNVRKKVEPRFPNITAGKIRASRQPLLIWKNVQYATHRRTFDPAQLQVEGEPPAKPYKGPEPDSENSLGPGKTRFIKNKPGDPDLVVPAGQRARYEAAFAKFCSVFPDMFYKQERGRNYFDTTQDKGRYLSAGFHNVMGYFRDDQPLYELLLDESQQAQLDEMWTEMDFIASATTRMYVQFAGFGEAVGSEAVNAGSEVLAGSEAEDKELSSEVRLKALQEKYLAMAEGGDEVGIAAVRDYFENVNAMIREDEKNKREAVPRHLDALEEFAGRAYRRPLAQSEKDELRYFYQILRDDGLNHEESIRESVVGILMSPDLMYRIDLVEDEEGIQPLSDYALASRMSYFIWSSLPDAELLSHAAAGDLHRPEVIAVQAGRMLRDPRARALAVEFGGNWLDFRSFETVSTVDLEHYPNFTKELKNSMMEEPVRFLLDLFQGDRPILDCLYGKETFLNSELARHYGIPFPGDTEGWVKMDVSQYGRGGILPMAVFLTKNAPGLRTSPVKRGNWVVKNVLGERIPAPPADVPELPQDESKMELPLREMLARHREDPNCSGCHARFDSMGLVFEGFGMLGEIREVDLAGRMIDPSADFPGGGEGVGLEGLQNYIRDKREEDFVKNLSSKLLAYALGRSIILSDKPLIEEIHGRLSADHYRFDTLVESIVTSNQFLTKRGKDSPSHKK